MACYDTAPYTCTYDSGGNGSLPGGGNPDYSALATWEAASDNDLAAYTGPVILDCYDSQTHNNAVAVAGATNTSASVYRVIRSAPGCAIPWAGKAGTGANFYSATLEFALQLGESYSRLECIYVEVSISSASEISAIRGAGGYVGIKIVNCVAKSANPGTGNAYGFWVGNLSSAQNYLLYNCIALNCKSYGFINRHWNAGDTTAYVNCVAIGCGVYGFSPFNSATGVTIAFNCYGADNQSGTFNETASYFDTPSGWNASNDTTADLGGAAGDNYHNGVDLLTGGELDADYLATVETLYENGAAGARFGRNPYNDLSATVDFYDFLKNDAAGEAISKKDIIGYDRPTPDTADASWNVGASQLGEVLPSYDDGTPTGGLVMGGSVVEVGATLYTDPAASGGLVMGGEEVSTSGPSLNEGVSSGGIVLGGTVAEQWETSPNNCVAVKGGTYRIDGTVYTLAEALTFTGLGTIAALVNVGDAPAAAGEYRYDLLSIDAAGTITVTAGAESSTPVMPATPTDEVKLNHVLRYYGQTAIIQADIGKYYQTPRLTSLTITITDDELAWGETSTAIAVKLYDQYGALYTGSTTINASLSSGNGTITPASISGTASTRSFTYTRGGTTGDVSPVVYFSSPTGVFNMAFISLLDSSGDLMV
ncbi:MAG: hypothetical protein WC373_11915 [Smithella sp.]|jgi:hypothetical protein